MSQTFFQTSLPSSSQRGAGDVLIFLSRYLQEIPPEEEDDDDPRKERTRIIATAIYIVVLCLCVLFPTACCASRYLRECFLPWYAEQQLATLQEGGGGSGDGGAQNVSSLTTAEERKAAKRKRLAEKRRRIEQNFRDYRVVLTENNFSQPSCVDVEAGFGSEEPPAESNGGTAPSGMDRLESFEGHITISIPSSKAGMSDKRAGSKVDQSLRISPNCCAICLTQYAPDDVLVWSSNPLCAHAFHEECITAWLMKLKHEALCPCCRRDFISELYGHEEDGSSTDGSSNQER